MNPLYQEYAGTVTRALMIFFGPTLAKRGLGESDISEIIGGLISASGLVWGLVQKVKSRQKLVVALASPAGTNEAAVDVTVKSGAALPPVGTPKTEAPTLAPAAALAVESANRK